MHSIDAEAASMIAGEAEIVAESGSTARGKEVESAQEDVGLSQRAAEVEAARGLGGVLAIELSVGESLGIAGVLSRLVRRSVLAARFSRIELSLEGESPEVSSDDALRFGVTICMRGAAKVSGMASSSRSKSSVADEAGPSEVRQGSRRAVAVDWVVVAGIKSGRSTSILESTQEDSLSSALTVCVPVTSPLSLGVWCAVFSALCSAES